MYAGVQVPGKLPGAETAEQTGGGGPDTGNSNAGVEEVSFEQVLTFAIGEMGMYPWDFYRLTMGQYMAMVQGYYLRRERLWEQTRFICSWINNVNATKKEHLRKPQQIVELSFDKNKGRKGKKRGPLSAEEEEFIYKKFGITPPHKK